MTRNFLHSLSGFLQELRGELPVTRRMVGNHVADRAHVLREVFWMRERCVGKLLDVLVEASEDARHAHIVLKDVRSAQEGG